jgi:Fuc2NAc and GlcNAc transferase
MLQLIRYICTFLLSFCITVYYRRWAIEHSVLDIPNERSSHELPTPSGGGIAIIISFYLGITCLYFNCHVAKDVFFALLPGLVLAMIGFYDDIRKLNWLVRLTAQFLCSGIGIFFLGGMHPLFGNSLPWVWNIVALIGIVWFINLFNFMDGSDGYASMEAISISLGFWLFTGNDILALIVFSVGGFLYWNWPTAKIFMGDSGSTALGYILVIIGIYFHNASILGFSFWIIITALFWFDANITIIRRIFNKEKINQPHKKHMYQRALQGGFSHLRTLLSGLLINVLLFMICLGIYNNIFNLLTGFLMTFIILLIALKFVDWKFPFKHTYT